MQILFPITFIIGVMFTGLFFIIPKITQTTHKISVDNAVFIGESVLEQYKNLRRYYTQYVVDVVEEHNRFHNRLENNVDAPKHVDLQISWEHKDIDNTIALPASMIHDLGELTKQKGVQVQLYSLFPFPSQEGRVLDNFQKDAWSYFQLSENLDDGVIFVREDNIRQEIDGRLKDIPVVRLASADKMTNAACVSCHNSHPQTPKKDWAFGDVRGILEVVVPVNTLKEETNTIIRQIVGILIGGTLFIWLSVWFSVSKFSRSISEISTLLHRLSLGVISNDEIKVNERNEIGNLQRSFFNLQKKFGHLILSIEKYAIVLEEQADVLATVAHVQQTSVSEQLMVSENTKMFLDALLDSSIEVSRSSQIVLQHAEITQENAELIASYIEQLSHHVAGIGNISNQIKEISMRSDILALNAALEGTKAGEKGQGFSLVATQMQLLAEEVMEATKAIKELTINITKTTKESINASKETNNLAIETTNSAHQITFAAEQQKQETEHASKAIDEIVRSANQTSTASLSIVEISFDLISLSYQLRETLKEFKK